MRSSFVYVCVLSSRNKFLLEAKQMDYNLVRANKEDNVLEMVINSIMEYGTFSEMVYLSNNIEKFSCPYLAWHISGRKKNIDHLNIA